MVMVPRVKKESVGVQVDPMNDGVIPTEQFDLLNSPSVYYHHSLRQVGIRNPKRLWHLHQEFVAIATQIKERHSDPDQEIRKAPKIQIPFSMIAFIANAIEQLISSPEKVQEYQLIPWVQFKQLIYGIYSHRIDLAPEWNGLINTNPCSLNDHLLLYFVEMTGSRDLAEERVSEVLINLIFYFDHWPRARLFAYLLQVVDPRTPQEVDAMKSAEVHHDGDPRPDKFGDSTEMRSGIAPHAFVSDEECLEHDIFVQEYFLHCFACLMKDSEGLIENPKGNTFIRFREQDLKARFFIGNLRGAVADLNDWRVNVREQVTQIEINKVSVDFVDLDILFNLAVSRFIRAR